MFVNRTGNHFVLLFFGEFIEINGISRNADRKLRILFGMFLRIEKRFTIEYVYVEMVSKLSEGVPFIEMRN